MTGKKRMPYSSEFPEEEGNNTGGDQSVLLR